MPQTSFRLSRAAQSFIAGRDTADLDKVALAPVLALGADDIATVLGVPGSGKTFAIIEWVKAAVAAGRHPDSILVIAANRTSATTLRDRLAMQLQTATGGALARTLNSFAFGLLHSSALKSGEILPTLISGSEQDRILTKILADIEAAGGFGSGASAGLPFNQVTLGLAGFRNEVRDLIAVASEHQLTPNALAELGQKHGRQSWVFGAEIFDKYLQTLTGPEFKQRFEPAALLHTATNLVKASPDLVADIDVVLVDDSQELTPAAVDFLRALVEAKRSGDAPARGIFLFGDPDASTLGFRAADPQTMTNFTGVLASARGESAKNFSLNPTRVMRPAGLSAVMARITNGIDTALGGKQRKSNTSNQALAADQTRAANLTATEAIADLVVGESVETVVLKDRVTEVSWLARRLRELHLNDKIEWADIAVVARSRHELSLFETALASESVPTRVVGAQTALRDEFASRSLLRIAQIVLSDEPVTYDLAIEMLTSPFAGLDHLALRRLRRVLRRQELDNEGTRTSDELIEELFASPGSAATLENPEGRKAHRFVTTFFKAKELAQKTNFNIEDLLWLIFDSSRVAKNWQALSEGFTEVALQANRNLDAVSALFAAAKRFAERESQASAFEFIENQLALGLPEDSLAVSDRSRQTVQLITPSGLIGRRFKVVCLPALIEGAWPNLRPRSTLLGSNLLDALLKNRLEKTAEFTKSEMPDELRLLYKAVGATQEKLIVSSHISEDNQVSQFVTLINGQVPSVTSFESSALTLRAMSARLRRDLAQSYASDSAESQDLRVKLTMALAKLAVEGVAGAHPSQWYGLMPLSSDTPLVDLTDENSSVYLRPSSLDDFLKCPLHWFINAYGGNTSSFEANLGSIMHKAVELATTIDEADLMKTIETAWPSLTFAADWVEELEKRNAKRMVGNVLEYLTEAEQAGTIVVGREVAFNFALNGVFVNGKVDRIEQLADGRILIVDLKTGSFETSAKHAAKHPQLLMYQLAYENGAFDDELKKNASPETIRQIGMGEIVRPPLAGAQLWVVKEKNTTSPQASIEEDAELHEYLDGIFMAAKTGMAANVFVAKVGSHCNNDQANKYASCSIHLVKPVSYVA